MLLDKSTTVNINDIVSFKLISGEEIVGKLKDRNSDSIFISKPIQINVQPVSQSQMGIVFLPVLASAQDVQSVHIPLSAIAVRPVKSSDDVRDNYIKATTGLVSAPPGMIVT